jgi:2-desacetyl-2-hydroxyethyl bacteriochlorophyllide A dehydrogenase
MRAAIFERAGQPQVCSTAPDPRAGPGDLIVKVGYSGVCGTDLHLTQAGIESGLPAGMILGHEFCGEVVEVGRGGGRDDFRIGDWVTVMPYRACPACGALCRDGLDIICPNVTYLGIAAPGGNAEYVAANAAQALRLPEGVDLQAGALVEPLAVGLHAVRKAGSLAGQKVLVIGGGPVGLAVTIFASLAEAAIVMVSEPSPERRLRALAFRATGVADPFAAPLEESFRGHAGGPPDVVFECVGVPGMIQEAVRQSRLFGRVVVVGACMEPDQLHPITALVKEISMSFALGHDRGDFSAVLEHLHAGAIDARGLVTGVVDFDAFPAAFEGLRTDKSACKLLLRPN